jgi:hypothetical protein
MHSVGSKTGLQLHCTPRRPATCSRPKGWLGHGLAVRPSCGGGPHAARAPAWSPRAARARAGVVTHLTVARWGLAAGKVLPASTGGVPGWRRARRAETRLIEEVGRRWGSGKWPARRRSGGRAAPAGWRCPWGGPVASCGGGCGCGVGAG